MKIRTSLHNNNAISEIVGSVILLLIAVLSFSAIYLYVFPLPGYSAESNVDIQGSVSGEYPELVHVGGETLQEYQIFVDGSLYLDSESTDGTRYNWEMGERKSLNIYGKQKVDVMVISKTEEGGSEIIFEGEFENPSYNEKPEQDIPLFYSSLLKNSSGEDLICFKNGNDQDADGDSVTYIYTWHKNDESLATLYYPCNTNSPVMIKDYSDSANNGVVSNVNWTISGKVGGCYFYTSDGFITCDLPKPFTNLSTNDFSITVWVKSNNISENQNCILEAYNNNKNFIQLFQQDERIYAGVCVENSKFTLKTDPLSSNIWYHIGLVWNSSNQKLHLYVNGLEFESTGSDSYFLEGNNQAFIIGQKTDESSSWNGSIDEIYVYDFNVTEDHIYQQYLCAKDGVSNVSVLVSEETSIGDKWSCYVTPNDGFQDGISKMRTSITIE